MIGWHLLRSTWRVKQDNERTCETEKCVCGQLADECASGMKQTRLLYLWGECVVVAGVRLLNFVLSYSRQ